MDTPAKRPRGRPPGSKNKPKQGASKTKANTPAPNSTAKLSARKTNRTTLLQSESPLNTTGQSASKQAYLKRKRIDSTEDSKDAGESSQPSHILKKRRLNDDMDIHKLGAAVSPDNTSVSRNPEFFKGDQITLEEQRFLNSPRWCTKPSPSSYKYIKAETQPQQYGLRSSDIDLGFLPRLGQAVLKTWTFEDEMLVQSMGYYEIALWATVDEIFEIPVPEILRGLSAIQRVSVTKLYHPDADKEIYLEDLNWGESFCSLFTRVISYPAFANDFQFLRYVLQYALHLRLPKAIAKPRGTLLDPNGGFDIFSDINKRAAQFGVDPLPPKYMSLINATFTERYQTKFERAVHPYMDFIEDLEAEVKVGYMSNDTGLITQDLKNIINAWDQRYVHREETGRYLRPMMTDNELSEKRSSSSENEVEKTKNDTHRAKRTWILDARMRNAVGVKLEGHNGKDGGMGEGGLSSSSTSPVEATFPQDINRNPLNGGSNGMTEKHAVAESSPLPALRELDTGSNQASDAEWSEGLRNMLTDVLAEDPKDSGDDIDDIDGRKMSPDP